MCYGASKTARDIVRDFSDDQVESLLKLALALVQSEAQLEAPGLIGVLDLVAAWAYWTTRQMLSGVAPNIECVATRVSELFVDTKLLKGMPGYDWTRKLRPYCVTAIARLHISEVRNQRNRERIVRKRAVMLARASHLHGKACRSRLEHLEDIAALRRAIARLPRLERRAVILRHWFRVSSAAGGERLGIAPQRFTRAVCNGLRMLRGMLGEDFLEEVA